MTAPSKTIETTGNTIRGILLSTILRFFNCKMPAISQEIEQSNRKHHHIFLMLLYAVVLSHCLCTCHAHSMTNVHPEHICPHLLSTVQFTKPNGMYEYRASDVQSPNPNTPDFFSLFFYEAPAVHYDLLSSWQDRDLVVLFGQKLSPTVW